MTKRNKGEDWDFLYLICKEFNLNPKRATQFKEALRIKKEIDREFNMFMIDNNLFVG